MSATQDNLAQALALTEQLSPKLRELVELVGITAAAKILQARSGRRFYVPKSADPHGWLVMLVGVVAAEKMIREMGGAVLEVAMAEDALRAIRNARMRHDHFAEGVTADALAARENLSLRQVWTILGDGDTLADNQLDLYG